MTLVNLFDDICQEHHLHQLFFPLKSFSPLRKKKPLWPFKQTVARSFSPFSPFIEGLNGGSLSQCKSPSAMDSLSNCVIFLLILTIFSMCQGQTQHPHTPVFQTMATLANQSDCWLCQHCALYTKPWPRRSLHNP